MLGSTGIGISNIVTSQHDASGDMALQEWGILCKHCIILSYYHPEANSIEKYSITIHMYSLEIQLYSSNSLASII